MQISDASVSIVIPAFNEQTYLGPTLAAVQAATDYLAAKNGPTAELIVVDNGSTDCTADIARSHGARVVDEPRRGNVAVARNAGARAATGDILVFVDADTLWPETLLYEVATVMADESCFGGAVDTEYRPARFLVKAYLRFWRVLGKLSGMAQGATQFS